MSAGEFPGWHIIHRGMFPGLLILGTRVGLLIGQPKITRRLVGGHWPTSLLILPSTIDGGFAQTEMRASTRTNANDSCSTPINEEFAPPRCGSHQHLQHGSQSPQDVDGHRHWPIQFAAATVPNSAALALKNSSRVCARLPVTVRIVSLMLRASSLLRLFADRKYRQRCDR